MTTMPLCILPATTGSFRWRLESAFQSSSKISSWTIWPATLRREEEGERIGSKKVRFFQNEEEAKEEAEEAEAEVH